MAGLFRKMYEWLLRMFWFVALKPRPRRSSFVLTLCHTQRATQMDVTVLGLQNAGKTSLLRVLAVSLPGQLVVLSSARR